VCGLRYGCAPASRFLISRISERPIPTPTYTRIACRRSCPCPFHSLLFSSLFFCRSACVPIFASYCTLPYATLRMYYLKPPDVYDKTNYSLSTVNTPHHTYTRYCYPESKRLLRAVNIPHPPRIMMCAPRSFESKFLHRPFNRLSILNI